MNRLKNRLSRLLFGDHPERLRPLYALALTISWPAALEGLLISVISSADTMMVGGLGPQAIAAVGLAAEPRMIMLIFSQAVNIGTTALVARRHGARNQQGVRACLEQVIWINLEIGVLTTLLGFTLAEPFMRLAGANREILALSAVYFRIIALGFIPNNLQLCVCAAFRGLGKTRVTMVTHLTGNVVNLLFNYLLIEGRLGFPRLEVAGAAIATNLGMLAACMLSIRYAMKKSSPFRYRIKKPVFDQDTVQGLRRIGGSTLLEMGTLRAGFLLTNRIIASLGTSVFAASRIVSQVSGLSFTLGDGVAAAGVALVGQALGAGDEPRAREAVSVTRRISFAASLMLVAALLPFRHALASLFTQDEQVILAASAGFLVMIPAIVPQNARVVYAGCLRGAGDTRYVAMVSLIGVGILRPLLTWLFCFPLSPLLPTLFLMATGPWWAFLLDALVRSTMLSRRVRGGKWTSVQLH